jgi:N-methylhydantoinase A
VPAAAVPDAPAPAPPRRQAVRDTATGEVADWPVHDRAALPPGASAEGPCIIAENETSTLVAPGWRCRLDGLGYLELFHGEAP